MKVVVFTSNQPRHLALIDRLADTADEVYAVLECNTVFPGQVADFFTKSEIMQQYFSGVAAAERHYFGNVRFTPDRVSCMAIKSGDLNRLTQEALAPALKADAYVVFGSSFVKGWLAEFLIENYALNIHMGLSPYYRGSSCNFWAVRDGNPAMVGATIHLLTKGLDSGPILRHAVPTFTEEDPFHFTMKAVVAGFDALIETLNSGIWRTEMPIKQDKSLEVRYTKNSDFTDEVVADFLRRKINSQDLKHMFATSALPTLLNPLRR